MTTTDGTGAQVVIDQPVQRVVCLTGVCDDVLVSLGLAPVASSDAGEGGLLADEHYLGPTEAAEVAQVGGSFGDENVEDVLKAEPDLVIGLAGVQDQVAKAIGAQVPTYLAQIGDYQQMEAFTTWVGQVTQREDAAAASIAKFEAALAAARERRTAGTSSLSIYGTDVNFGVDTDGSLLGSVLEEIGDYPWPEPTDAGQGHQPGAGTFSLEEVLRRDPTVIFVQTFSFGPEPGPTVSEQLAGNPVWSRLSAVQDGRVVEVPTDVWATGRGPISLTLVLEQATEAMYGA